MLGAASLKGNRTPSRSLSLTECIEEIIILKSFGQGSRAAAAISDEMIEAARDYPISQMFDFKRGRTRCPFHNSKGDDLSHHAKSNRVHCFGSCGRSWGTIDVAMDRDGMTFIEAVKHLASG